MSVTDLVSDALGMPREELRLLEEIVLGEEDLRVRLRRGPRLLVRRAIDGSAGLVVEAEAEVTRGLGAVMVEDRGDCALAHLDLAPGPACFRMGSARGGWVLWVDGDRVSVLCAGERAPCPVPPLALSELAPRGRVLRLGGPRAADTREMVEQVRGWIAEVPLEALVLLEEDLADRAWALGAALAAIPEHPEDATRVGALLIERDDLQSARVCLGLRGRGWRADRALRCADEDGEAVLTTVAALAGSWSEPVSERLAAVSWCEPERWWALPWRNG